MLNLKEKFVGLKRKAAVFMAVIAVATMTALPALAAEGDTVTGGSALESVIVTEEMLTPIVDAVSSNVRVILPVGVTIFGILLGIFLIPKLFQKFKNGN